MKWGQAAAKLEAAMKGSEMDKKLWIVVRTSDADAGDVGVLGVFDNREAAYECMKVNDYCTMIGLHHYPVQSTYEPENEEM